MKSNFWEQNVFNIIEGSILKGNNMSNVSGLNSVKQYPVPVVSFKAKNPYAGMPMDRQQQDMLILSEKQSKQEKRQKWSTIGSVVLASAFAIMALVSLRKLKPELNMIKSSENAAKEQAEYYKKAASGEKSSELQKMVDEIQDETLKKVAQTELEKGRQMRSDKKIKDLVALSKINGKKPEEVDLEKAIKVMDEKIVDMPEVKEQILDFLIHWNYNIINGIKNDKPLVLCLDGAPGTGKTTITEVIAEAIGAPYKKIALGGASGSSIIRGTESKFVGAEAGGIARGQIDNGTKRVVYCLDEAEKVAKDSQHGDPHAAMASLTDGTGKFEDDFLGATLDTSESIFVLTTNEFEKLPSYLQSRVRLIKIAPYGVETKTKIAKMHLTNKLNKSKLNEKVRVSEDTYQAIADLTTDKGGRDTTKYIQDQLIPIIEKLDMIGKKEGNSIKFKYPDGTFKEIAKLDASGKMIVDKDFINFWLKDGVERPALRDQFSKAA